MQLGQSAANQVSLCPRLVVLQSCHQHHMMGARSSCSFEWVCVNRCWRKNRSGTQRRRLVFRFLKVLGFDPFIGLLDFVSGFVFPEFSYLILTQIFEGPLLSWSRLLHRCCLLSARHLTALRSFFVGSSGGVHQLAFGPLREVLC